MICDSHRERERILELEDSFVETSFKKMLALALSLFAHQEREKEEVYVWGLESGGSQFFIISYSKELTSVSSLASSLARQFILNA